MIPSSLLIKIFGVSVAGFLTIGVSVMVHEANKTIAETARKKLFGEPVPETLTDEEFSKKLSTWTPTAEKQKYLLDNWAASINHLPASFFTQYYSIPNPPKPTLKGVCFLTIWYYLPTPRTGLSAPAATTFVHIPFLKNTWTATNPPATIDSNSDSQQGFQFLKELYETTKPRLKALGFIPRIHMPTPQAQDGEEDKPTSWHYGSAHCLPKTPPSQ